MLQPGTVLSRKYRIEAVIGQGSLGTAYRARDQLTGERMAIKELVPALTGRSPGLDRYIEKVQAALGLTHRNVARVYDIFQDGNVLYLAMEYLPGGSLADLLRFGPLPVDESLRIVDALCNALVYAHDLGVMHCGIKPSNVLFDAGGGVHLADFALAQIPEELAAQSYVAGGRAAGGTMQYMAPEQLDGACDDPRTDLYALGALLYEMLVGQSYLDFESETTPGARLRNAERIETEAPRSPLAINPDLPQWLADIVMRALQKALAQRYASVAEFQHALSTQDAGQPLPMAVPPESGPESVPEAPSVQAEEPEPESTVATAWIPAAAAPVAALQLALPDGGVLPLVGRSLIIGRGAGSDLMLSDTQVSRRHAAIEIDDTGVQVIDLDSAHGTFVNDRRLARQVPHPLQAGDTLRLGESTVLQVLADAPPPPLPSAVVPPLQPEVAPEEPELWPPAPPPVGVETPAPKPERKALPRWIWALLAGLAAILLCLAAASALLLWFPVAVNGTPTPAASVPVASPTAIPGVLFTDTATPDSSAPEPAATTTPTLQATPSAVASATATPTPTATLTPTATASPTATSTSTPSPTATLPPTATPTQTWTPSPTPTWTSSPAPTATEVPAPTATATTAVQPGPSDLVVESIDFLPFPPQQGLGNQVIITIRNDGPGNAGPFAWAWQAGSAPPSTGRLVGLESGDSTVVTLIWVPTSAYASLLTIAEVDTANEVVESNEGNNRLQVDVEVVQRP